MSRTLWEEFVVAFSATNQLEAPSDAEAEGQDLPIFLYTREHPDKDPHREDASPDIAYIGLDEANEEIVTHICLDAADPESPRVLLQILEQNNYLFSPSDPTFSLTPDGKAVAISARHSLRSLRVEEWSTWLEGFLDTARLWNQDLERLSQPDRPAQTGAVASETASQSQEQVLRA